MLISIVVPVYNVEKYLHECLDSIIAQTYKDIEVILVDDGSTDHSGRICDDYADKYENFQVIHKENAGLGMARNTGLGYVHGEYVMFLDSDDYLDKKLIEILLNAAQENHADVCKSGFKRITDDKKIVGKVQYNNELFSGDEVKTEFLSRMLGSRPDKKDSIEMCVWGAIYKTSYIKEYNLQFPSERVLISEDLVFNIDYMQYAVKVCILSYTGYFYRVNIDSLSRKYRPDRFEASRYLYLEMHKKLVNLGYSNMAILRLQRLFFVYIRMSIAQETRNISRLVKKENIANLKKICSDSVVKDIISEYPVGKLGLKQQIFLRLIRLNMVNTLYLLASLKII